MFYSICCDTILFEEELSPWGMDEEKNSFFDENFKSKIKPIMIIAVGLLASIIQPVILFLSGKDINDAIWPHAYNALQATMWLRDNLTLMFFFALMMLFASLVVVNNRFKGKSLHST